jgi:RNA polymerase sigma-70 factor (ECF subfamily)
LDLVRRALAGDPTASDALVAELAPKVQFRVNATLVRRARSSGIGASHEDVRDLVQEVFLTLFEHDGKVLRTWDPTRGAALRTFVGLVADRVVGGILRSGRRSGWKEDPTEAPALERAAGRVPGVEEQVASRQELARVLDRLRETLTPRGMRLFRALFVEQRPAAQVAAEAEITVDALYAWRSRLRKQVRALREELASETGDPAQKR